MKYTLTVMMRRIHLLLLFRFRWSFGWSCVTFVSFSLFCRKSQRISAQNRTFHRDRRNHLTGARLLRKTCKFIWAGCDHRNPQLTSCSVFQLQLCAGSLLLLLFPPSFLQELMKVLSYFHSAFPETHYMNNRCYRNTLSATSGIFAAHFKCDFVSPAVKQAADGWLMVEINITYH